MGIDRMLGYGGANTFKSGGMSSLLPLLFIDHGHEKIDEHGYNGFDRLEYMGLKVS